MLEVIGCMMLFSENYIQRIAFVKAVNVASDNIHERIGKWTDYLNLREQNAQLLDENTKLRNILLETFYIASTSKEYFNDTLRQKRYAYFPAKIINKTVNRQYNYLTIDKGLSSGITENMAIIGHEGIVGIVYSVSERFAKVMPVINLNFKVSVKFKKNNYFGSLSWDGNSYRHASLNEISLHVPVQVGDTIVVSGYSNTFPEGIPVGTVDRVEQKDGSFYTIDVLLATDFRKLHYVSVIEDLMITERQTLENNE
jgi:rod shape-determining protein MreC